MPLAAPPPPPPPAHVAVADVQAQAPLRDSGRRPHTRVATYEHRGVVLRRLELRVVRRAGCCGPPSA
jgi:hypothetical protein